MRNLELPAKSKMATRGIQNGKHGLAMALIPGYWSLQKSSPNRYFDPSTPSMRNVEPPAKSKIAARGPKDGQRGLERGLILGFWALRPTIA